MTANDLISGALKLLGVLGGGETASGEDAEDARLRLNDLVDSWTLDRRWLHTVGRTLKTLTANVASYTIGSGASIDVVRPIWIEAAGLIIDTGAVVLTEVPIEVLTDQKWQAIRQKTLTSSLSAGIFYDYGFNSATGFGLVYPWPVPSVGTTQLVLYLPAVPVSEFADLITDYTAPQGYRRALRFNLARELAPEFGKQLDPTVREIATESRAAVKVANGRLEEMGCDAGLLSTRGGVFNWLTGDFTR